jgi:hypothetical protein
MLLAFHFTCDVTSKFAPHHAALKFALVYTVTALRAHIGV